MSDLTDLLGRPPELEAKIACVKREIGLRHGHYPKAIAAGRMTKADADRELGLMRRVLFDLEMLSRAESVVTAARAVRDRNGAMLDPAIAVDLDRALGELDRFKRTAHLFLSGEEIGRRGHR